MNRYLNNPRFEAQDHMDSKHRYKLILKDTRSEKEELGGWFDTAHAAEMGFLKICTAREVRGLHRITCSVEYAQQLVNY